ncbi:MAG: hypothetical protein HYY45_00585 [Deltaproteobacteria bacterium]|nr:hypothetical protein [Deltaproteobacteria bacterium]
MKPKQSPLFVPALWEEDHFKIVDETLLPWKVEYITVRAIPEALRAVKEMKTRAFGQVLTFLYAAALVAQGYKAKDLEPLRSRLAQLAEEFTEARPTFDFQGLAGSYTEWFRDYPPGEEPGRWFCTKAIAFADTIVQARNNRARLAAGILPDPCRLLTHCNISGELVAVAEWCRQMGKEIRIVATETRPYLQGSRLTAWELSRAGFRVALIPDCAIAQVMAKGEVNAVLVGADRCAQNGDVINKVGTYPLALMAKEYNVPFHALVQEPGLLAKGEDVLIEERPVSELFAFQSRARAPEGLKGRYPAFDLTPSSLITTLIGFDSALTPESFRQRFHQDTHATANSKKEGEPYLLLYGIPKRDSYAHLSHALKAEQASAVLVPEMRPALWGARVITRELLQRKIPATLISDNMMGAFFAQGQIKRLYLFYSELSGERLVGICGSLLAVRLARTHAVPIELLSAEESQDAPPDRDVSTFLGQRVICDRVTIYPIEKEVIPWSLLKESRAGSA